MKLRVLATAVSNLAVLFGLIPTVLEGRAASSPQIAASNVPKHVPKKRKQTLGQTPASAALHDLNPLFLIS